MRFIPEDSIDSDSLTIDITPLIDIVFLLLIFFMVSTSFVDSAGINVNLPSASQAPANTKTKDVIISIKQDGTIYLSETKITIESLRQEISKLRQEGLQTSVLIRADKEVGHGVVVSVMDIAKSSGIEKIAIATSPGKTAR